MAGIRQGAFLQRMHHTTILLLVYGRPLLPPQFSFQLHDANKVYFSLRVSYILARNVLYYVGMPHQRDVIDSEQDEPDRQIVAL